VWPCSLVLSLLDGPLQVVQADAARLCFRCFCGHVGDGLARQLIFVRQQSGAGFVTKGIGDYVDVACEGGVSTNGRR
jgi:hypothetical protein